MEMQASVLNFGAVGDGVHDDYAAIQKALDSGAKEILIPQGVYCVSQTLKVKSNTCILAEKTAKICMKSLCRRTRNEFLLSNEDTQNGNENITIIGGIWDGFNTLPENQKPDLFDKNGYSGSIMNFVHVNKLTLKSMVLANSVTYYVRMSRVHHFVIEDIDFVSDHVGQNQDGLHFGGDVKHGSVKNIRALSYGQTNDDMVALNADDSIERVENLDLCRDNIEDITFQNIFAENCHTIIRMLSVTAQIKNIRFKNIYGGFRCNAINADAARYCRTPLFKEEDFPQGVGLIQDVKIENFVCFPILGNARNPQTALKLESYMDKFEIRGFQYITEHESACPALMARNLIDQKICADDKEYMLKQKEDAVTIGDFKDLTIDLCCNSDEW